MRGSRTWFALAMNWVMIFAVVIGGGFHAIVVIAAVAVIITSFFIVSGEMKWWRNDMKNLTLALEQVQKLAGQVGDFKSVIKNAPVIK